MRGLALFAVLLATTSGAQAGEKPILDPAPGWVVPVAIPAAPDKPGDTPVRPLLVDNQLKFERGRVEVFSRVAMRIETAKGLSAGNIALAWRPDVGDLHVHRLVIRRGDQVIDVLGSGQTFTVIRRERNLEAAMFDGVLTASIQPEGLQVGDVIEMETSVTASDPVLGDHVEQLLPVGGVLPVSRLHLRASWPNSIPVRFESFGGAPVMKPVRKGGESVVELSLDGFPPVVPTKLAPARFNAGRFVQLTDYTNWSDLGALFVPLFDKASVIPASGPLADEVAKIRATSTDPKMRATAALALVQDRVRYVALAMGAGSLTPADAGATWGRRYGDCKAKTALLIGILRALDIAAEPVLVSSAAGDGLDARLPMVGAFDHVLVRATIAGKPYWLDGTRAGDTSLDRLEVPNFRWGLPVAAHGAALVKMVPPPLATPRDDTDIRIDATGGVTLPAPIVITETFRGDPALWMNNSLGSLAADARDRALRDYWKKSYDFVDPDEVGFSYDRAAGEVRLTLEGKARMDWRGGYGYEVDGASLGYKADFSRDAASDRNAPFAVDYPEYSRVTETIQLSPSFPATQAPEVVERTVAGVEYRRRITIENRVFRAETSQRAAVPEFPAAEAPAAEAALRAMDKDTYYLKMPANYRPTKAELAVVEKQQPTDVRSYTNRAYAALHGGRLDDALSDYTAALALTPKDTTLLLARVGIYFMRHDGQAIARDLAAIEAVEPNGANASRARAMLAEVSRDRTGALAIYTRMLESDPNDLMALSRRAELNKQAGNQGAALSDAAKALAIEPRQPELYLLRGNILRAQGKPDLAAAEMRNGIAANPDVTYVYVAAGKMFASMGRQAEAEAAYDKALTIEPKAFIYLNRAESRPLGDIAGRAADADAALKLEPDLAEAMALKAEIQAQRGDLAGALTTYDLAVANAQDNPEIIIARGVIKLRLNRPGDAERDFALAHKDIKDAPASMLNSMCWKKATAGVALASALADCDAALAKEPKSGAIADSRAFVLLRMGRLDDAIIAYGHALDLAPGLAASHFGRAVAYAHSGNKASAEADAAAARAIDPEIAARFRQYGVSY